MNIVYETGFLVDVKNLFSAPLEVRWSNFETGGAKLFSI